MKHTRARMAALIITAGLALAACGGDGDDDTKPAAAASNSGRPENLPSSTPTLVATPSPTPTQTPTTPAPLGQAATTAGQPSSTGGTDGGELELTPLTVVYSTRTVATKPVNAVFVTVAIKQRPTGQTPAKQVEISDGGGWQYLTPDGQAIRITTTNALMVYPKGFYDTGTPVEPGTFTWDSQTWDLTEAQRGGVIIYTDAKKNQYRWQLPAQDAGPQVAELKSALG